MEENKWATYEANVQSYRSNFLSSQSIMLAVGAITLQESYILTLIIAIIAIIQMWYIWFRVIYCRCIIVDYYKFLMYEHFDELGNIRNENSKSYLSEYAYVKKRKIRKNVNYNMRYIYGRNKKFTNMRVTRIKIDVILPITMTAIWLAFVFYFKLV